MMLRGHKCVRKWHHGWVGGGYTGESLWKVICWQISASKMGMPGGRGIPFSMSSYSVRGNVISSGKSGKQLVTLRQWRNGQANYEMANNGISHRQ